MISIKSYAKINLVLNVHEKMENGYHRLDSIMLPISLHDSILISKMKNAKETYVTIDDFSHGLISYNIASAAIEKLREKYGFKDNFRILIHKVIPMQAGLGGGSSNALFTMRGVCKLLKLNPDRKEQIEISKTLGADVPFFVDCKPARARGVGEELEPIFVKNNYFVIIVKPKDGLATKDVFAKGDEMTLSIGDVDKVIEALETGNDELLLNNMNNSLEAPAIALIPEIKTVKDKLFDLGLKIVSMTGSGSAVFAMSTDKNLIKKAALELEDEYTVEVCKVLK